ncbi:Lipoprotein OS=Streptomyces glaucescens OX=1907 GN=SGLAU_10835 PE=4 SV=1 [Streptomyces glaucescens]
MARSTPARVAVAAGAVVLLVAGLGACSSAGDDEHPEKRSFTLEGTTLTVDSDDSALEIVAADGYAGGRIRRGHPLVRRLGRGGRRAGDDLGHGGRRPAGAPGELLGLHRRLLHQAPHRRVPHGVTVKVEDGDGSIRASGFWDALTVRTGDGSVHVTDTTGPLDLRTGDGSVRVEDATGPLRMHTNDGSIRADVDSRQVRARTGDGSVRLELGTVPDLVESRSGDGSVTIALPRATYRVATDTGDGAVDVSVPHDDASGHVVSARTGDGKVTVRTAN